MVKTKFKGWLSQSGTPRYKLSDFLALKHAIALRAEASILTFRKYLKENVSRNSVLIQSLGYIDVEEEMY